MADVEEEDELETDEHGIYREKTEDYSGSENGLMVDEDGIWQDDIDSYYHGGNDSGFCTAEQKSSSSLNNRCQDGADAEQTIPGSHKDRLEDEEEQTEVYDEEEEEEEELRRKEDHPQTDEHSYNISELEASRSASVQGSQISGRQDMMEDVNSDSRYPELAKGYFTSESELSKQDEGNTGRHGDSEYMAYYREEDSYYTTNDEERFSDREQLSERDHYSSSGSMKSYTRRHPASAVSDDRRFSNSSSLRREHSRIPSPVNYRMAKREQEERRLHHTETVTLKSDGEKLPNRRPERAEKSNGSSSIRQELQEKSMSQETEHSLVEFEQLEATLDEVSSSCSEDLIGLYLRETEQWGIDDEATHQTDNNNHSSSLNYKGNNMDNRGNSKVQDFSNGKHSQESHSSSRTNERELRPPTGSRSERTSRRAVHDAQKRPDSRNHMSQSSEKSELGRSQETRNLLQKTSEALTKLNQERNEHGHHDTQPPAALQGSQIPILRSRSASLTRPGRHWSRSRRMPPSPSHSQSSLSSPQPQQHRESEPYSSKDIQDSMVNNKRFSTHRQSLEAIGGRDHSSAQVGRIDSLRSHGNSSPASSRHATSVTSQHQVPTSSAAELSRSGYPLEEREPVNRVVSQMIRNADDDSTAQRGQNPAQLSSVDSRKSKKSSSSAAVNQNGASTTSWSNIDRHQSLRLTQSESRLRKKRSNSLGGSSRLQQPLKAVPRYMKSSVPDAIGATSQRMGGTNGLGDGATVDFKEMYQAESQQHRMTVETYQQLHVGYLHLLKENAEIKNTVDSMRLGAEVRLIPAAPLPVSAEAVALPPARHANTFTLSKMSTPSLSLMQRDARVAEAGKVTTAQRATLSEISQAGGMQPIQPPVSQRQMEGTAPSLATKTFINSGAETSNSLAQDVLSLSGRIKATDDQVKEFQRCWDENDIHEKMEFLQTIRGAYAELEDEFDNDFVQDDGIYSSASRTKRNAIESQLVQLHLNIGQLEDDVEATIKSNDASHAEVGGDFIQNRMLFPAASSVNANAWNAADSDSETQSFRHRGSVISLAGNLDEEEQFQDFNKTYTELMDQYRRLKQMKGSLQRDDEIAETLTKLKKVYRQIPEHRKPALPAELENQYNPVKGSFVDTNSEQEEQKQNGRNAFTSLREFNTSVEASTVMNDSSDMSSGSKPDSVKRYPTSERHSKEQSSASQSNASGSSQISLQRNGMPPNSQAKGPSGSRSRDISYSVASEKPRHGSRRLPNTAAKSKSQAGTMQDEFGNGYRKLSGSKRSTYQKPPLPSNLQINAKPKAPGLQTKTEQRMIRTSARTPPGQSYSDTESDGTDDTVEEIFKQKQKRDQFDNTDGFPQSKTKDENRKTTSVGSTDGERDGTASVTGDELSVPATNRSDKRENGAASAHLQKFTVEQQQQRQMPQPIPLHPTTAAVNPSVTFYVPALQGLQNPYSQRIQQPGLQQLPLQHPDIHQVYVPTGTVPSGTVPAGIIPANIVTGNQGAHGNYFTRNGYILRPHEPTMFLENGHGQSTSMAHPEASYNAYQMQPNDVVNFINDDRKRNEITRNRHRLYPADRHEKSSHRSRTSRKRHGSRSQDDPLPSVYFEPTAQEAYPYLYTDTNGLSSQRPAFLPNEVRPTEADVFPTQYADPYSFVNTSNPYGNGVGTTGVGSGLPTIYESLGITSRGIQNVPSMSTTGVQYMVDGGPNGPYTGGSANTQHGTGLVGMTSQLATDQPVVVTGSSCPLCGRVDYHTHTDSNVPAYNGLGYVPTGNHTSVGVVPALSQRGQTLVQLPDGQTGLAFLGTSPNTYSNAAFPSTLAGSSSQAIPVPIQALPPTNVTSSPSRVRYYVREYGGQSTVEEETGGIRHQKKSKHKSGSSKHHLSTDNDDNDDDDDVDWALLRVVSTAKSLKKRSEEMTTSLHNELLLSFRDSTTLQSF